MAPRPTKPLEQTPGSLFERDELPTREVIDGSIRAMITAHERLEHILELADGHGRGRLLELGLASTKTILEKLREARRAQIAAAWRR